MIHAERSPLAGKVVMVLAHRGAVPDIGEISEQYMTVEDWWDRVSGGSWMTATGNPACLCYAMRTGIQAHVPTDDEVLYGKIGAFGVLVHVSEVVQVGMEEPK